MDQKCLICKESRGSYYQEVNSDLDIKIYKCSNCGLEYTIPVPTDQEINDFYRNYKDIRAKKNIVIENSKNNLDFLKKDYGLTDNSLIIDFGCGDGDFVEVAGENCYGIDLKESSNPRIYDNLNKLPVNQFDYITLWGVLEHINDIKTIMQELIKYLKPDGHIVITTVNAEGDIPYYYKPPEHLTYWTKKSLTVLSEMLNCELLVYEEYFMKQYGDVYLDRLLSRTPTELKELIINDVKLPEIVTIPTNEVLSVFKYNQLVD